MCRSIVLGMSIVFACFIQMQPAHADELDDTIDTEMEQMLDLGWLPVGQGCECRELEFCTPTGDFIELHFFANGCHEGYECQLGSFGKFCADMATRFPIAPKPFWALIDQKTYSGNCVLTKIINSEKPPDDPKRLSD